MVSPLTFGVIGADQSMRSVEIKKEDQDQYPANPFASVFVNSAPGLAQIAAGMVQAGTPANQPPFEEYILAKVDLPQNPMRSKTADFHFKKVDSSERILIRFKWNGEEWTPVLNSDRRLVFAYEQRSIVGIFEIQPPHRRVIFREPIGETNHTLYIRVQDGCPMALTERTRFSRDALSEGTIEKAIRELQKLDKIMRSTEQQIENPPRVPSTLPPPPPPREIPKLKKVDTPFSFATGLKTPPALFPLQSRLLFKEVIPPNLNEGKQLIIKGAKTTLRLFAAGGSRYQVVLYVDASRPTSVLRAMFWFPGIDGWVRAGIRDNERNVQLIKLRGPYEGVKLIWYQNYLEEILPASTKQRLRVEESSKGKKGPRGGGGPKDGGGPSEPLARRAVFEGVAGAALLVGPDIARRVGVPEKYVQTFENGSIPAMVLMAPASMAVGYFPYQYIKPKVQQFAQETRLPALQPGTMGYDVAGTLGGVAGATVFTQVAAEASARYLSWEVGMTVTRAQVLRTANAQLWSPVVQAWNAARPMLGQAVNITRQAFSQGFAPATAAAGVAWGSVVTFLGGSALATAAIAGGAVILVSAGVYLVYRHYSETEKTQSS